MARRITLVVLALVVLVAAIGAGAWLWQRGHRTHLEAAMQVVPASSKRIAFTDWELVRSQLHTKDLGRLMDRAYDTDFSAASSIDDSAEALQRHFGFSPANAQWEAYAQSEEGATMVLSMPDADFADLAGNLRSLGYQRPKSDDGVWVGGVDLVSGIDVSISPELQYVALLADQHLVVSSDTRPYAARAAAVAKGEEKSAADSTSDLVDGMGDPAAAMVWTGDFACEDLAMSQADEDEQAQADQLLQQVGGVSPLTGLAMSMAANRELRVVAAFEDDQRAEHDLRPRARLAVGEAVGRGGSFSDDFRLTSSKAVGNTVRLVLKPKEKDGYVLSALYDGPVVFASC